MSFYTSNFLSKRRGELLRAIGRFEYQLNNGAWRQDATINEKKIENDAVVCYVSIPNTAAAADVITGARVYDANGVLAGSQTISLSRTSTQTGLLRFEFPLVEG
jgi:hypothetical protein